MNMRRIIIFFFAFFCWFPAFSQSPIYVSSTASGSNDGSSWADAYTSLADGLDNASFGDEVWVRAGTYTPWDTPGLSFELPSGVKLYGGFDGTESSLAERDWEANPTILSGNINGQEYSKIVLLITDPDTSTLVDGFTIKDAVDFDPNPLPCSEMFPCYGGGVEVFFNSNEGSPGLTVRNCIIRDNFARLGAGMTVWGEGVLYDLFLENILVEDNTTYFQGGGGGGIIVEGGREILVSRVSFENNYGYPVGGGFVFFNAGETGVSLTLKSCFFYSNSIDRGGGAGIAVSDIETGAGGVNLVIDSCEFYSNNAGEWVNPETYGLGGAIFLQMNGGSTNVPKITNSLFIGNYCDLEGGAIYLHSPEVEVSNCVFIENNAGIRGGAIFSLGGVDSKTKITNCTFIDNQAQFGSAVYGYQNNLPINNSIFRDQINSTSGFFSSYNANITVDYCYFSATDCDSLWMEDFSTGGTFNCGPNNLFEVDPQFIDEANGDYRLDYCSPLIDAGNRSVVEQLGIQTDIAGAARIINGAPDIGAYENDDVLVNLFTQDISCPGKTDGMAQIAPAGGQPPWTAEWSMGSNGFSIDNLQSGSYWVSLTDANACSRYWAFEIGEATPIEAQFEVTDAWSVSSMDGAIDLEQISGGNPPYTYNWNTGDTTSSLHDLSPGEYSLTITDTNGCDTALAFIVGTIDGIRDFQGEDIRLYPNPGQNRLWIEALPPNTKWQLFDAMGRLQMQGQTYERRFSVQTTALLKGVYFLRFYHSAWSSGFYLIWVKM